MAVTPETGRWEALFASRTRGDVGEGIAFVLGFLGKPDLISFAGGLPDPRTFPRQRAASPPAPPTKKIAPPPALGPATRPARPTSVCLTTVPI